MFILKRANCCRPSDLYQWHWQPLTSHLSAACLRTVSELLLGIAMSVHRTEQQTSTKSTPLWAHFSKRSENDTRLCKWCTYLPSPSHSPRHSCYYISATTASDALASQLNQKKKHTLRRQFGENAQIKLTETHKEGGGEIYSSGVKSEMQHWVGYLKNNNKTLTVNKMAAALNQQRPEMDLLLFLLPRCDKSFSFTTVCIRNISREAQKSTPTRR